MKIGITGTRKGMTGYQKNFIATFMESLDVDWELHHGDCIGADEQAHFKAIECANCKKIVVYPSNVDEFRAFCKSRFPTYQMVIEYGPSDTIIRNHAIANNVDLLIATPDTSKEQLRSGTWSTVRYARKIKKNLLIVNP